MEGILDIGTLLVLADIVSEGGGSAVREKI